MTAAAHSARGPVQRAVYGTASRLGGVEFLRAVYTRAYRFAPHSHPAFAVGVVRAGSCRVWHRGASFVARAGDLVLMNPGDPHSAEGASDGWVYDAIYFNTAVAAGHVASVRPRRLTGVVRRDAELGARIAELCRDLACDPDRAVAEHRFNGVVRDLFGRFGVASSGCAEPAEEYVRVREHIEQHYHRDVPLQELADIAGQNQFSLIRGFSRSFGMPPHRYLTHVRVEHARNLLRAGRPITDTALSVGFCDQSHLTRFFRGITGVPPGVYARGTAGV